MTFDVIVIGSSPLLLIEALYLERSGQRVAVVEQRSRLGGAWYTIPLWEFDSVEVGCHYIERKRKGYAFLEECLGLALEPHSVKALWINADNAPEDEPFFSRIARRLVRKALWGRLLSDDAWGIIKGIDKKDPAKCFRALQRIIVSPPYRYPAGGVQAMIGALSRMISASTIELLDDSLVEDVVSGADGRPSQCCIDGRTYQAKRLIVGQHAYPQLRMSGEQAPAVKMHYATHVVLRISGAKSFPFGYLEIHRNDLIQRVDDKSAFAVVRGGEKPTSDLLLCCHLTKTSTERSEVDPNEVFEHLIVTGLVESGARLLDSHVEHYPWVKPVESELSDAVTVFGTFDLGVALDRNADRWRPLFRA